MDNKGNQNKNGKNPRGQNYAVLIMTMLFTLLCVAMMHNLWQGSRTHKMPYSEFNQMLKDHEVESVVIGNGKIQITPKEDSKKYGGSQGKYGNLVGMEYYTIPINDPDLEKKLDEAGVTTYEQAEVDATGSIIMLLLEWVLPIAAMFVIFNMMMKRMGGGGGIMGVGKSNAKVYVQKETGVTFKDVAGEDEAKESLTEIVDFLHNPGKYTKIGAKLPKGALLVGPPGTGKTLLAKAVAGEAKVPFFSLSGSDFVEMFVGVGASRVRDLFKQAQQSAPCIIFIDEVDAIGKSRDSRLGGNDEREQTLNQLLSEMDGFDSSKGLLVMAATNRPEILDPALLRPGRFDRRIIVDKPDLKGRVQILKVHSKDVKLDETVDFEEIALATSGAVGADLANMMNEAAITAVKNGRKAVSQKDLFEAVELVLVGKEKKDRKSIMFFQYPGDVKGTGFLTWDYDELNKDDDKWLYLPAIKKTRRISGSSAKQDYFMGSDFTYDDMGSRNVDEDTHTLLGEETVDGQKCWKLESLPKDKRDIYSRKTALIRQDCLIPVRVEYYDKMGKLHRRLEMSDIAKVEGFWVARKMHMTNVQTEHQTVLEIKNPTYNIPMEESKFNVTTLEKGRF